MSKPKRSSFEMSESFYFHQYFEFSFRALHLKKWDSEKDTELAVPQMQVEFNP